MEIRDQLTLELISILQPAETILYLTGPLAYAPDGRSIACASDTAIIIWDIQTGGVAKEIKHSTKSISVACVCVCASIILPSARRPEESPINDY